MGLQLDVLTDSGTCVIENNTDGRVREFGCDTNDFLRVLKNEFGLEAELVLQNFSADELEDFFNENDIEILTGFWNGVGVDEK